MNRSSSNNGSVVYYKVDTNRYNFSKHGVSYQGLIVVRNPDGRIRDLGEYTQSELKINLGKGDKYFVQFDLLLRSLDGGATSSVGLGFYKKPKRKSLVVG